jgi:GT2 family glycosyltransferase
VAAVVVTYNRCLLLLECIEAIAAQTTVGCDILVIDNCSTDNSGESIKAKNYRRIKYYNTGSNLGGAGGFNYGIRLAVELGYEFLWIMDDD